jgi:hypothetical protein
MGEGEQGFGGIPRGDVGTGGAPAQLAVMSLLFLQGVDSAER